MPAAGSGPTDDGGSAVVEFVALGLLLLLPVVYLVLVLGRVQAASYASQGAARTAARAVVVAADEATGRRTAVAAVAVALADHGFEDDPAAALRLDCSATPCLTPGATVTTAVTVDVVLPGVPAFVDRVVPARVAVTARSVEAVDAFRETP